MTAAEEVSVGFLFSSFRFEVSPKSGKGLFRGGFPGFSLAVLFFFGISASEMSFLFCFSSSGQTFELKILSNCEECIKIFLENIHLSNVHEVK